MCLTAQQTKMGAYYIAEDIFEIDLPEDLSSLPQLGDIEETGIIGYIIIANGEEITIITDEEAFIAWKYFNLFRLFIKWLHI